MATGAIRRGQEWRDYGMDMRTGVDVGVDSGNNQAYCGDGRGGKVVCARGKGWYGSGGGQKLAHSEESDHTIANSTARAAGLGLRLRPQGECKENAVYACK